jgi:outer membrane protein assembly factor BamA
MSAVLARRILIAIFAAALAGPVAPPARAQQSSTGTSKLAAVAVTGTQRFPVDQIAAASGLTVGQVVTRDDLQAAADKLAELGTFAQVNYKFTTKPDGVSVQFIVQDAPSLPVEYDNIPWFTDDELTAALKKAVPLFDGGAPDGGTLLDQLSAALKAALTDRGVHAVVDRQVTEDPLTGNKILQFSIEGDSLIVGSVQFGDQAAASDAHVHQSLADIVSKPYSRMTTELFELEQVRPVYFAAGHLRVQFAPPVVRPEGDPNAPPPAKVAVFLAVDPGPIYRYGGAQWTGNAVLDAASLNTLVGLKAGDIADGMQIAAGWDRISQAYGHTGHLDAKVTPQETIDDSAGRVSYSVAIAEGPLYRMGDLIITGLSLDGENRVRAAFHLSPAQIFDSVYVDQFIAKLTKPTPEIFGDLPIHYTEMGHWVRPNTSTHMTDVLLDFK